MDTTRTNYQTTAPKLSSVWMSQTHLGIRHDCGIAALACLPKLDVCVLVANHDRHYITYTMG